MILKQNCFIISRDEVNAINNGTYVARQHVDSDGCLTDISYNGSSLQRQRSKVYEPSTRVDAVNASERVPNKKHVPKPEKTEQEIEHFFSKKSKVKISNKIHAWTRANVANKGKTLYNFVTCTLTSKQIGTDKDFTKMQNTLFTYMRKYFGLKNYLYVLERQSRKTNNVHSHIIIDQYVSYSRLNRVWCKILSEHGYTFPSHNYVTGVTEVVSVAEALRRYDRSKNYTGTHTYPNPKNPNQRIKPTKEVNMPNPLDVETVYSLKSITRYVTKYITKNESKINTSLWNCSQSISRLWTGAIVCAKQHYRYFSDVTERVIPMILDNGYVLLVNLLKYYTKVQAEIFAINNKILITNGD